MLRLRTAGVTAVLALALTGSAAYAQAPAPAAPEYQNLLTTLLIDNKTVLGQPLAYPASELMITAAIVTIPPGGETGWHFHEVPLFVYIMSGEVTVDYGSEGTRTFEAGASFMEAFEWAHNATNTGTEPVEIMAVYLGAEGLENAVAVDGPIDSTASASTDDHVVAMDHFRSPRIAQNRLDFRTVATTNPVGVTSVEGDQTASNLFAPGSNNPDSVASLKTAADSDDTGGQEAFSAPQRPHGARVDNHGTADL